MSHTEIGKCMTDGRRCRPCFILLLISPRTGTQLCFVTVVLKRFNVARLQRFTACVFFFVAFSYVLVPRQELLLRILYTQPISLMGLKAFMFLRAAFKLSPNKLKPSEHINTWYAPPASIPPDLLELTCRHTPRRRQKAVPVKHRCFISF